MKRTLVTGFVLLLLASPLGASAAIVTVAVENSQAAGGFAFTPAWHAFHDGSFDLFDSGAAASPGIELLAELGDSSTLDADFVGSMPTGASAVLASAGGEPPFIPGEANSAALDIGDATVNRFFSYGAMVVPSNDLFFANGNPMGVEVFDAAGNFLGPITIQIFGSDVWDAGTEVNDISDGPAFIVGQDATLGTAEGGVVHAFFGSPGADDYIMSIVGLDTPAYTLADGLTDGELLATITITPEPTSLAGLMVLGLAASAWRRR